MLVPLTLALVLGLFYIAGAQAVHDDGVFELEGNALTANDCTNPPTNDSPAGCEPRNPQSLIGGEDWDLVYLGTDSADSTAFEEDTTLSGGLAGAGDSILSQDTKDIQAIADWTWKQTTSTSVQDKADIEHAYAAQYDDHLYFGADRYSNSGDTVMGFWFFRQEIGKVGPDAQGNGTFTGAHTARETGCSPITTCDRGDILIVSDFRSGGKAPQIQVYEWVVSGGSASTNLDLIGGSTVAPASCTQAPGEKQNDPPVAPVANGDPLCATANQFIITAPWEYDAKSNSGGTSGDAGDGRFGVATFMEGGIDLSAFGFGDTCFSSFMAETRASHSVTSTLSDFVLGGFGECTSGIVTTPSDNEDPPAPLGSSVTLPASGSLQVTDKAVVTVTGVSTWSGTVSFWLCGPADLAPTTDKPETCTEGGTKIGADKNVSNPSPATVFSDPATITAAGKYCWRATFSGDADKGVPGSTDSSATECFTVTQVQTAMTTRQFVYPQDKVSITVPAGGGNLAGDVRFTLHDSLAECQSRSDIKYDSGDISVSGASPQNKTTNNTSYAVTDGTTHYWNVSYTPTNSQLGSSSECSETTAVTFAGNDASITVP